MRPNMYAALFAASKEEALQVLTEEYLIASAELIHEEPPLFEEEIPEFIFKISNEPTPVAAHPDDWLHDCWLLPDHPNGPLYDIE